MDRSRKKLIEELIRVGRLIDPAPGTVQKQIEDTAELPVIARKSDIEARSSGEDFEDPPVVNDVVDRTYTTKDMFAAPAISDVSRPAMSIEGQQPAASKSGFSNTLISGNIEPLTSNLEKQVNKETTMIGFPVDELARELVTLIEDRVSQRSGEQLDDTFRDELTLAVFAKLEGWLKYD